MSQQDFANLVLSRNRIADAISTGAGWEVWLQVELLLWCRDNSWDSEREVKYPASKNEHVDLFLANVGQQNYAIEIKVESANNAVSMLADILDDLEKLESYKYPFALNRWVLGVAYTIKGRDRLKSLGTSVPGLTGYYNEENSIGVVVVSKSK